MPDSRYMNVMRHTGINFQLLRRKFTCKIHYVIYDVEPNDLKCADI